MKPFLLLFATLTPAQVNVQGGDAPFPIPTFGTFPETLLQTAAQEVPEPNPGAPAQTVEVSAPLFPSPAPAPPPPAARPAPVARASADRWWLMQTLQGTGLGWLLDDSRVSISGWVNGSDTPSTTAHSNLPITWNDRANTFLLQQGWVRIERTVLTSGTSEASWGFRVDTLTGSDYRFTLPRGLWNSQLVNSSGGQNLYGVDMVQQYLEFYVPTFLNGLDLKIGRFYTPWGAESIEAVNTPFISRSYAFNWSPPFTHCGAIATMYLNRNWTAQAALVNGNDVYWGDPSEEPRFVGTLKYLSNNSKDVITLATSWGRGKFNQGDTFNPSTTALLDEPNGRNNLNAIDLYWVHLFDTRWSYQFEGIYGWQTNVPNIANPQGFGNAHWFSFCNYLFHNITPQLTGQVRAELFEDCEGQRTGYPGLYEALTCGMVYRPKRNITWRAEIRGDYNGYSLPVEGGKHGIMVGAVDFIIRW